MTRALVIGLAATGEAVALRLRGEGVEVVVADDQPGGSGYEARRARAEAAGATVVPAPSASWYEAQAVDVDLVVPSPLVTVRHPAVIAARSRGVPVRSEIDLAAERTTVPIVAVTGTNGKTTVTSLTAAMLRASGLHAIAAGNIGRTLLEAVDDKADVFVVEVSSFQLAFAESFRPRVAVLLGVAEDHIDWHETFANYVAAKARVFEHQRDDDLLVFDRDDAVAADVAASAPARRVGVSITERSGLFCIVNGELRAPDGHAFASIGDMRRALPHDLTNALASAAAAIAVGATERGVRDALVEYETMPHRVALVGEHGGVQFFDDSKATNPHATAHAVAAFDSVVLIAGGRNKGLDLSALAASAARIRAVVAFGEAAPDVVAAFADVRPVEAATSMRDAVERAADRAESGDAVLLSPACASFDAYDGYAARGDDFTAEVRALIDRRTKAASR